MDPTRKETTEQGPINSQQRFSPNSENGKYSVINTLQSTTYLTMHCLSLYRLCYNQCSDVKICALMLGEDKVSSSVCRVLLHMEREASTGQEIQHRSNNSRPSERGEISISTLGFYSPRVSKYVLYSQHLSQYMALDVLRQMYRLDGII